MDIAFEHFKAFLASLLLFPYALGQWLLWRHRKKMQKIYTSERLLPLLLVERWAPLDLSKSIGWAFVWLLLSAALMGPYGNLRYAPSLKESQPFFFREVVFVVDTSASMRTEDVDGKKNRLNKAQELIQEMLDQLHGEEVALFAFTSELTLLVPLTLDYIFTRMAILDLRIDEGDVGGTNLEAAIAGLKREISSEQEPKDKVVILLSDGGDTVLEGSSDDQKAVQAARIKEAVGDLKKSGAQIFTIGIGGDLPKEIPYVLQNGKPVSSKLFSEPLEQIAVEGGGLYYKASDWNAIDLSQEIKRQIDQLPSFSQAETSGEKKGRAEETRLVDPYYQAPLGLALLFCFLIFLLPDVRQR